MSFLGPACLFAVSLLCLQRASTANRDASKIPIGIGIQDETARRHVYSVEEAATKACSTGHITGNPNGVIASPGFSQHHNYGDTLNCRWTIRVPPNKMLRMVVEVADIRCPDALELFNYKAVHEGFRLATVCGPLKTNAAENDDTAIFTDTDGVIVTFTSSAGGEKGRGFRLSYTMIDPEERPCGVPRIKPHVPGIINGEDGGNVPFLPEGVPPVFLRPDHHTRIYGGFETVPFSWPWHASVGIGYYGITFCGSAILNKRWVLTAAHCVGEPWGISDLDVTVGLYNVSNDKEPSQQIIALTDMIIHPDYNPNTYDNDIALLRLADDIRYAPEVSPICLPTENVAANTICVTTGWGKTSTSWPDVLNQVNLPIVNRTVCKQESWHGNNITEGMLCAGYPEGAKDACNGDSGSPLVCKIGHNWVLHGLTSWGKGHGCGDPNSPGVYVRVFHYMDWVNGYIYGK